MIHRQRQSESILFLASKPIQTVEVNKLEKLS